MSPIAHAELEPVMEGGYDLLLLCNTINELPVSPGYALFFDTSTDDTGIFLRRIGKIHALYNDLLVFGIIKYKTKRALGHCRQIRIFTYLS